MKKLIALAVGLAFTFGTMAPVFAAPKKKDKDKQVDSKKKKKKKKGKDNKNS